MIYPFYARKGRDVSLLKVTMASESPVTGKPWFRNLGSCHASMRPKYLVSKPTVGLRIPTCRGARQSAPGEGLLQLDEAATSSTHALSYKPRGSKTCSQPADN